MPVMKKKTKSEISSDTQRHSVQATAPGTPDPSLATAAPLPHSSAGPGASRGDKVVESAVVPITPAPPPKQPPLLSQDDFDSEAYLEANPDVAKAVKAGEFASVYEHYLLHGAREGRPLRPPVLAVYEPIVYEYPPDQAAAGEFRASIDTCVVSWQGGLFLVGWMDDGATKIETIRIAGSHFHVDIPASVLLRVRRPDVEAALGKSEPYCYGFCALVHCAWQHPDGANFDIEIRSAAGASQMIQKAGRIVDKVELRDISMSYLATTQFFGNPEVERIQRLGTGFGAQAVALNRSITHDAVSKPYVERFCERGAAYKGSIVVCLYGKSEFYFLQHALFGGLPGIEDYEFVYVCNSPELAERLLKEAHSASRTYGLSSTIVILSGNAGFGAANNVAVQHARSGRVLIVNPDVFPRSPDWAANHTALVGSLPDEQTRIFGSTLYYDDGSLMHGGMYFEEDTGLNVAAGSPSPVRLLRVEHYGKGAADSARYSKARPVPAVTGAFISVDRPWFETLGGFTEDFVFGHYEDADLCLRSLERGFPAWIHDLDLWHLEGKGSTRKLPHEGGSSVNRWLFTQKWARTLQRGLLDPAPTNRILGAVRNV
jgi:GT2 family glycosyltransferase